MPNRFELNGEDFSSRPQVEAYDLLDKPHEECGVVGICLTTDGNNIPSLIKEGLANIQHRGQEAAGMAVSDGGKNIEVLKDVGLVGQVFGGNSLAGLPDGNIGVGHVRYGTVGLLHKVSDRFAAAGPAFENSLEGDIAISLNGNILDIEGLCRGFGIDANLYATDTAGATACVAKVRPSCSSLPEALQTVFSKIEEAYSIAVMGEGQLIAIRDPRGFRPLMLGTYPDNGGYAIASETPALKSMGATFRREIVRGEMVVIKPDGSLSSSYPQPIKPSRLCVMEHIYLAAPQGELGGHSVQIGREEMGRILAREHPVEADVVVGIPDSGMPAAEGFALESGIPKVSGLIKNRYSNRTFITPNQESRESDVRRKLEVIQAKIYQQKLVVCDDSIVRGTTTKAVVAMLREDGAKEVHLRISSPPYIWPCYYGLDTRQRSELIANMIADKNELEEYFGVDSLEYLSIEGLREATADFVGMLCMACMTGDYPTDLPDYIKDELYPDRKKIT